MSEANRSRALYYPYIRVPESPWFTQVLLYWDKVGAIVPYDYIENPNRLGAYMVGLVREQLVEQIIPGQYLWKVKNFAPAFLQYIDTQDFKTSYQSTWPEVHMEKLQEVGNELHKRGLARRQGQKYSPWYKVEPRTAARFMAYLAAVLGQITEERFYPITENDKNLSPFINRSASLEFRTRKIILEGILPTPLREIEPARLSDFKAAHKKELRRFRLEVEDKISELSSIVRKEDRDRRCRDITAHLRFEVEELTSRMREEKKWPKIGFADFCAIVGSGVSALKAWQEQDLAFGVAGVTVSLAPAVYNAFRGANLKLEDQPLAYAASAGLEFK
jgi:hypothetical protein